MGRAHEVRAKKMAATSAAKSALYMRASKEIYMAAKSGEPDPNANLALRAVLEKYKGQGVTKEVIERAINKAKGGEATAYEAGRYEGFGPGKVAVIVEAMTDNKNRTAGNVRTIFGKRGGVMGESGSVAFNFERIGYIKYPADTTDADKMFETALEAGANDVVSDEEAHEIETVPEDLNAVTEALEKAFGTPSASRLDWKATVKTNIDDLETAQKFLEFVDALEDDDDVQKVYHNAEFSDEVMKALEASED